MKKIIFSLAFSFLFSSLLHAQEEEPHLGIGLTVGPSFPVGTYATTSINTGNVGCAELGTFFSLDFEYRVWENVGFSFRFFDMSNQVNASEFKALVKKMDNSVVDIQTPDSYWDVAGGMLGIYRLFPLDDENRLVLKVKGEVGPATGMSPKYTSITKDMFGNNVFTEVRSYNAETGQFGFILGCDLNYRLNRRITFSLKMDYVYANQGFYPIPDYTQQFKGANLSLGFMYKFSLNNLYRNFIWAIS